MRSAADVDALIRDEQESECVELVLRPPLASIIGELETPFRYGELVKDASICPNTKLWMSRTSLFSFRSEGSHMIAKASIVAVVTYQVGGEWSVGLDGQIYYIPEQKKDYQRNFDIELNCGFEGVEDSGLAFRVTKRIDWHPTSDVFQLNLHQLGIDAELEKIIKNVESHFNATHRGVANIGGTTAQHAYGGLCRVGDNLIACGSCGDFQLRLWDPATGAYYKEYTGKFGTYRLISFRDEDGHDKLLSVSTPGTLQMWDIVSDECTTFNNRQTTYTMCYLGKSKVALATYAYEIEIWDLKTNSYYVLGKHSIYIYALKLMKNGLLISADRNAEIKIWDLNTRQCLKSHIGHADFINGLGELSNGYLVSIGNDQTLKIWDISQPGYEFHCVKTLTGQTGGFYCVDVLPNDMVVTGSYGGVVEIWDPLRADARIGFVNAADKGIASQVLTLPNHPRYFLTRHQYGQLMRWKLDCVVDPSYRSLLEAAPMIAEQSIDPMPTSSHHALPVYGPAQSCNAPAVLFPLSRATHGPSVLGSSTPTSVLPQSQQLSLDYGVHLRVTMGVDTHGRRSYTFNLLNLDMLTHFLCQRLHAEMLTELVNEKDAIKTNGLITEIKLEDEHAANRLLIALGRTLRLLTGLSLPEIPSVDTTPEASVASSRVD